MNEAYKAIEKDLLSALEAQVFAAMGSLADVARTTDSSAAAGADFFSSCAAVFSKALYLSVLSAYEMEAKAIGKTLEMKTGEQGPEGIERVSKALDAFTAVVAEMEFQKK